MSEINSGARQKKQRVLCKKCDFHRVVNEEELCSNCEDEEETVREICNRCSKRVKRNERGLQCDSCRVWHHVRCEQVEEVYEV